MEIPDEVGRKGRICQGYGYGTVSSVVMKYISVLFNHVEG